MFIFWVFVLFKFHLIFLSDTEFFCCVSFTFRATIQAISAYLDAFQKIADAATNSRGNFILNNNNNNRKMYVTLCRWEMFCVFVFFWEPLQRHPNMIMLFVSFAFLLQLKFVYILLNEIVLLLLLSVCCE